METAERKSLSVVRIAVTAAAIAAVVLVAFAWLDARNRIDATQAELASRLRDIEADARDARAFARQAQESMRESQARLGALEGKLADTQGRQAALEALYQDLSRNREEWQLAELEQVLAIAAQQLQLSGNVRAALNALQLAESRLARGDRPQLVPVRRALARDIERLKALPAVDLPGMVRQLDALAAGVDALPLAFDSRIERAPQESKPAATGQDWFSGYATQFWAELRQLIVVRRIDAPEPPLLAPTQAYFLRENLRLRLLNARLDLLTRNQVALQDDLRLAQAWLQRYFDARAKPTQAALAQLRQLQSATLNLEPAPSIADSLEAVRGYKARRERSTG
jgi:uroporphyrin-3 C-methyltransferase